MTLITAGSLQRGEGRADWPGQAQVHRERRQLGAQGRQTQGGHQEGQRQRLDTFLRRIAVDMWV